MHIPLWLIGYSSETGGFKELSALVKTQAQTIESLEARLATLELSTRA
jgi:hypothetical protein